MNKPREYKADASDHDAKYRDQQSEIEFGVARDIADFAVRLDETRDSFPPELRGLAMACAQKMHILAEAFAGDRAGELYGPDDGSETPPRDTEEECHL